MAALRALLSLGLAACITASNTHSHRSCAALHPTFTLRGGSIEAAAASLEDAAPEDTVAIADVAEEPSAVTTTAPAASTNLAVSDDGSVVAFDLKLLYATLAAVAVCSGTTGAMLYAAVGSPVIRYFGGAMAVTFVALYMSSQ